MLRDRRQSDQHNESTCNGREAESDLDLNWQGSCLFSSSPVAWKGKHCRELNSVAMWNNGREYEMTKDLRKALKGLGMGKSECKWILKTGFDVNFPVKDSAVEEMDWIEENHPDAIKSPYPLED